MSLPQINSEQPHGRRGMSYTRFQRRTSFYAIAFHSRETRVVKRVGGNWHGALLSLLLSELHIFCWRGRCLDGDTFYTEQQVKAGMATYLPLRL